MPVFHITLDCSTPTALPDGAFRTLVFVSDDELRDGIHLREAARRATIVGFGGPHRVLASRRLDPAAQEMGSALLHPDGGWVARPMRDRLDVILALGTTVDGDSRKEMHSSADQSAAACVSEARPIRS